MRRSGGRGLGILLLTYQMFSLGLSHIPPVTLSLVAAMAAIYLGFVPRLDPYYHTGQYCLHGAKVWFGGEWVRLIGSVLLHADDMHLYFNMISFIYKGRSLERRFGSVYFGWLLAVFSVLCSFTMVVLSYIADETLDTAYMHQCAVGFSGVVFALKVLSHEYDQSAHSMLGGEFQVPAKWATWAELLLIQILVPRASFIGHLAGILVGLAYTKGPLKWVMDFVIVNGDGMRYVSSPRRTDSNHGSQGQSTGYRANNRNRADADFARYTAGLSEDEQLQRAMENSLQQDYGQYMDDRTGRMPPPYPDNQPFLYPRF